MKNICFQMNRKMWLSMLMALCLTLPALAQTISVRGTVVDSAGEPLMGASVIAQGTTVGVATDFDGNFTIQVAPDATLVVSYVGYESQSVAVSGQSIVNVVLKESALMLDEVVAIGYGTVKKEDATGSVATVKPSEIQAGLSSSIQDLLIGQTPGVVVTPSAGPEGSGTIRIRGGSSLNASNDPLIVLDGVPLSNQGTQGMGNALAMISPDNIESMTILKDASATAIYGSRASNGVIIITSKKGQAGKPQVNFTANMTVQTARKTWDVLNGDEYRAIMTNYWSNRSGGSSVLSALGTANTDWQDEVLRTTVSHDYSLSVGGKTGFLPYRVAVTYTGNSGIIKNTSMDRLTVGFNLTPEFFDGKLKVQANVKGYYIENEFADTDSALGGAIAMDPTSEVYTNYQMAEGSVGTLFNGYTSQMNGTSFNTNGINNPVAALDCYNDVAKIWRSNGNLQLDYALHFLPELRFNLNLGYDISKSNEKIITDANSPAAWDSNNQDGAGTDYRVFQYRANTLLDFYANYKKYFDVIKSDIDVTAGYSWQYFYSKGHNNGTVFTSSGYSISQDDDGNWVLSEGTERTGTTWNDPDEQIWKNHYQLVSFFGRLNYTFMDRYLLTFTMRADGTSRFSKDNRWGTFPSLALGWKISEESWMESARDWMNEFKLRLGWGITGQQDLGDDYFPYLAIYQQSTSGSYYPSLDGAVDEEGNHTYISTLYPQGYDSNLKWEETTTWNAGLDFGFLKNRITTSLDFYYRETKDLLSYVTVPVGSTTTNMLNQNIGNLKNVGIEWGITARPIVTKDFTWTVSYNVAWNKNEITKLNSDGSYVTTGSISGPTGTTVQVHAVGHAANSFYLYEQVYDSDGNPIEGVYVDQNGDGVISDDDRVISKSPDPKVTMTFGSTFNYKNWDFGFNLRASIGNYVYANVEANRSDLNNTFQNNALSNLLDVDYYFDGSKTTNSIYMSDYWLRNGSFLRCENITVGYTWPNLLDNQLRLRLYGAVQNPFVITKYKGLDPEVYGGIDNNIYPRSVTFNLGLVATF